MLPSYHDIRSRIQEAPLWFDEHGVPRYEPFEPRLASVYGSEVVLLAVTCQNCGHEFKVCMSWDVFGQARGEPPLSEQIRDRTIHYGDPPNVECCPAGPTMNSVPRRVLEFWRNERGDWHRVPELEVDVTPEWASEDGA